MRDENDIVVNTYGLNADFFGSIFEIFTGNNFSFDSFLELLGNLWTLYSIIALTLSALFIFGIIYAYIRIGQMSEIEEEALAEQEKMWKELHGGSIENNRWESVQTHLSSSNPNDWKLAIIEADVLLERMLEKAGYAGNTVGERLKSASSRSFATLDDAWTAHRVRNQIAHGGADFVLTQKIANETLILYERVFKEFDVL
jgi:hypothetical protein